MNRFVYTVTPRSVVILEKVITLWLVKKITAISGFRKFINVFTKARYKTKIRWPCIHFLSILAPYNKRLLAIRQTPSWWTALSSLILLIL